MHRLKKLPQNKREEFWVYLLGYFWKLFPTKNGLMKLIGICTQEEQQNNILSFFYFFVINLWIDIWLSSPLLNNQGGGSITMQVIFIQNRLIV